MLFNVTFSISNLGPSKVSMYVKQYIDFVYQQNGRKMISFTGKETRHNSIFLYDKVNQMN